jgi:hypothetical protein
VAGRSAGVAEQPGAVMGGKTYCLVSGVVIDVKPSSPHRTVDGTTVFFCCESCATYFDGHRDHVLALRGVVPRS